MVRTHGVATKAAADAWKSRTVAAEEMQGIVNHAGVDNWRFKEELVVAAWFTISTINKEAITL